MFVITIISVGRWKYLILWVTMTQELPKWQLATIRMSNKGWIETNSFDVQGVPFLLFYCSM